MKLQELIQKTDLDMTPEQVKAFFLGVLTAEKPLPFPMAMEEMLSATPEAKNELEEELKTLWGELQANKMISLQKIFGAESDLHDFLLMAKDQLDFYLTALSLSGTNIESCKDEDRADLIDDLENLVMELEDYLAEDSADLNQGEALKAALIETWNKYLDMIKR